MICADSSVFVDFLRGVSAPACDKLQSYLEHKRLVMSPFVLSELLSSPSVTRAAENYLLRLPCLEIRPGFFVRSGNLRRSIFKAGQGVEMVDVFIAQMCIDSGSALLAKDQDFLVLAKHSDLHLISD